VKTAGWDALFATGNPVSGKIGGDKIAFDSITSDLIRDQSISTIDIASNAITAPLLSVGAIGSGAILNGDIKTEDLASGSVTLDKISTRPIGTNVVGFGGVAVSEIINVPTGTSGRVGTVSLITMGRPVFLQFTSGVENVVAADGRRAYLRKRNTNPDDDGKINLYRNNLRILQLRCGGNGGIEVSFGLGAYSYLDLNAKAGTNIYQIEFDRIYVENIRMVAFEQ